jgi:hypothetical protein
VTKPQQEQITIKPHVKQQSNNIEAITITAISHLKILDNII